MDHKTTDDCSAESIKKCHLVCFFLINYLDYTKGKINNEIYVSSSINQ